MMLKCRPHGCRLRAAGLGKGVEGDLTPSSPSLHSPCSLACCILLGPFAGAGGLGTRAFCRLKPTIGPHPRVGEGSYKTKCVPPTFIPFSAFWLRSSVVSVLKSVITFLRSR